MRIEQIILTNLIYDEDYTRKVIPFLYEVSIGHALVCDALSYGLENTVKSYLSKIL